MREFVQKLEHQLYDRASISCKVNTDVAIRTKTVGTTSIKILDLHRVHRDVAFVLFTYFFVRLELATVRCYNDHASGWRRNQCLPEAIGESINVEHFLV